MSKDKGRKKPRSKVEPKGGKRPAAVESPLGAKRPGLASEPSDNHPRVIWRFGRADLDGPWGWRDLDPGVHADVLSKLVAFEEMTTSELFGLPGSKPIKPDADGFSKEARKRLDEIDAYDLAVDHLWELRLTGVQRVWGFRLGCLFFLLWWDPNHTVWPSNKRNT